MSRRGLIIGVSNPDSAGFHIAQALQRQGAELAVTYRAIHAEQGAQTAAQLRTMLHYPLETVCRRSFKEVFADLADRWGYLDFVVHTLAYVPPGALARPLTSLSGDDFAAAMQVSVHSLIAAADLAAPLLQQSRAPRVLTLTSAGDDHVIAGYHAMGVAKAALAATVRYLAAELGPAGILCNALRFSLIPTAGAKKAIGADLTYESAEVLARNCHTRTQLTLRQLAEMATLMCGPQWQHVTGQIITQDGGYSQLYFKRLAA